MKGKTSCLFRFAFMAASFVVGSDSEPPKLPRDTLPGELPLDPKPLGLAGGPAGPADNPVTRGKVQLGRKLFFDPVLSGDRTVACASCHDPGHGFAGVEPVAIGVRGRIGRRNAPTIWNAALGDSFFWDGRVATLEEQALKPITSTSELDNTIDEVLSRLRADADYRQRFEAEFHDGVTASNLAKAIASFERVLVAGDTAVDRFLAARESGLDTAEKQGLWLFESRGRCWRCHAGPNFSDNKFHNTGVSWGKEPRDLGRFEITEDDADRGRFKTPSLRGVALTAPYMHDGSLKTLRNVVEFYNRGGNKNPNLDPAIEPLKLTERDIEHLVAFLEALSRPSAAAAPTR